MGIQLHSDVPPGLLDGDEPDPEFSFAGRKKIGREELEEVLGTAGNLCWSQFLIYCATGLWGRKSCGLLLCTCLHSIVLTHSMQDRKKMLVQLLCASDS